MNSYNNKNHNNNSNNKYNKTNSTKSGFDLIVISLVSSLFNLLFNISHWKIWIWVSSLFAQIWQRRLSFEYLFLKFALQSIYLDLSANSKLTSELLKSGLVMYVCISSFLYCISFTFEWLSCFLIRYSNAAFFILCLWYFYNSFCFYILFHSHLYIYVIILNTR